MSERPTAGTGDPASDQAIRDEKIDAAHSLLRLPSDSKAYGRATRRLADATAAAARVPARRREPRPDPPA